MAGWFRLGFILQKLFGKRKTKPKPTKPTPTPSQRPKLMSSHTSIVGQCVDRLSTCIIRIPGLSNPGLKNEEVERLNNDRMPVGEAQKEYMSWQRRKSREAPSITPHITMRAERLHGQRGYQHP